MNSVHPPFLGQAQVAQKSWIVKNIFNTAKNFRENCFQGKCKLLKMLNVKSIFTTVKISRATLFFFMARENCSTILKLKTIFNTAKNFRENSVFMASASCSKFLNDEIHFNAVKNFWATLFFFRSSASCSKILNNKKHIFSTVNSGHPLFFRASTSCSPLNVKSIFNTVKNSRSTPFYRASSSC